jgi:hypothetical protein
MGKVTRCSSVIQRVVHRPRGVRDPVHARTLYAREPGDPANWPCRVAPRGPRRESKEYDGDERLREVGQLHSTCEALEQGLRCAVVCGEGGGKGADQGESVQSNKSRTQSRGRHGHGEP